MPFKIVMTILACNAVFVIIAVPLILRLVPRNIVYGFRTRSTLADDSVWYEANAYFGKLFLKSSAASSFLIVVLYFFNALSSEYSINAGIAVLVLPPLIAVLLTFHYMQSIEFQKHKT